MQVPKKYAIIFSILGIALGTAGAVGWQTHAASTTVAQVSSTATNQTKGFVHGTPPAAMGQVTAVNGNSITVTDKRSGASYTVDASNAQIQKISAPTHATTNITKPTPVTIIVSDIAVGDNVIVQGTVSGTTISATNIMDGFIRGMGGRGGHHFLEGSVGTVTAINGSVVTMQADQAQGGGVYTIDANSATVTNKGAAATLSQIKVGDKIFVKGTTTTAAINASSIFLGSPQKNANSSQ